MRHIRTNVSIPSDVKLLMEERTDVNWSAVATLAFKRTLTKDSTEEQLIRALNRIADLELVIKKIRKQVYLVKISDSK